ncbi:hypothetical protein T4B_14379 [Trichinella pseudospiralis]|uniref:Uncharacterized protein n=1 Tax=Trichinella pseudospiralis TaxID=6337 RepID=A0A0V1IQC8_TRIPS|nr:hypothetical protein T4A_8309 [Trichinella pseudospiralis]KRZ24836.1 hypothetical protein T4B_14379 [Trichinella pseudospiralis]KRZ42088.1 hypothetical protein T4C_2027 [Trichinella pseudospiralis]
MDKMGMNQFETIFQMQSVQPHRSLLRFLETLTKNLLIYFHRELSRNCNKLIATVPDSLFLQLYQNS